MQNDINMIIDINDITDPLISYELYRNIMPEFHNLSSYITMISAAYGFNTMINIDPETKRSIIEKWISSFDENSWIAQAYAGKILSNLDKFNIIVSPVGFVDYIDVDEDGYVTVNTLLTDELRGANNYRLFDFLLEKDEIIPLLIHDRSLIDSSAMIPDEDHMPENDTYAIFSKRIQLINERKNHSRFSTTNNYTEMFRAEEHTEDEKPDPAEQAGTAIGFALVILILLQLILPLLLPFFL